MIHVTLRLVDFMEVTPVANADVAVTVKVVPRWPEHIRSDSADASSWPSRFGPIKAIDVMHALLRQAEDVVQQRTTGTDGTVQVAFPVSDVFQRQRKRTDALGRTPTDVVAVLEINIRLPWLGWVRTVPFFRGFFHERGIDLLGENADVKHTIAVDYAKVIVGHTLPRSVTLWFNLHGKIPAGDRCVCEVRSALSATIIKSLPVSFKERADTAVVPVDGLEPSTAYRFALRYRTRDQGDVPGTGIAVAKGTFTTAPAASDHLEFVFGSCDCALDPDWVDPVWLERWWELAKRYDYDLLLLIGDQIYADDLERVNGPWFEQYVNRYHQSWTKWPMREVVRHTPTYMVLDDHDVKDDWGADFALPRKEPGRIEAALEAYRLFQQSHNPGGQDGPIHYHFRWGPAAFFVMDNRTARRYPDAVGKPAPGRPAPPTFPILGPEQYADLQAWAGSADARAADVIFFVSPVPIAFLHVEEVRRLVKEVKEAGEELGRQEGEGWGKKIGAALGGGVGLLLGGPPGAAVVAVVGGGIGRHTLGEGLGEVGAYIGYKTAADKIKAADLGDLLGKDLADMWAYQPLQKDLTHVLDCLFDLANDVQPDGRPGPHPRAVFILAGDVHAGAMHRILSNRTGGPNEPHQLNPVIYQLTSSAISQAPADDPRYAIIVSNFQEGVRITADDLKKADKDFEKLLRAKFGAKRTEFKLDSKGAQHYHTELLEGCFLAERNFGRIELERVSQDRRIYRFHISIEGQKHGLYRDFEFDLGADELQAAAPVRVSDLTGSLRGRVRVAVPRDGALLKEQSRPEVFVVYGGAKFHIPSPDEFTALGFAQKYIRVVSDGQLAPIPDVPLDSTLLKELSRPEVYVAYGGAKFHISNREEFIALGFAWDDIRVIPDGALARIPDVPRDGALLKERSRPDVYVIRAGQKSHIPSEQRFEALGYSSRAIQVVPDGALASLPDGPPA